MSKLDELKARVYDTRVFYHPDAEATLRVSTIKALIAAVEALKRLLDTVEPDPRRRWVEGSAVNQARAALAPFGDDDEQKD